MAAAITARIAVNPFPGLRCFTPEEAHLFFGRDGQSDELVQKLEKTRFVAITGSSGSGKSSLAAAGLIPSLCSGYMADAGCEWKLALFRPRNNPLENLSEALKRAGLTEGVDADTLRCDPQALRTAAAKRIDSSDNVLILVDQFEELFRFKTHSQNPSADRDEKAAFVNLLLEAAAQREMPLYVAITLRSDFLGDCSQFRNLPEAINESQYLVPRLTRDQRRMAIQGPIQLAGAEIAPRLLQRLLNENGEDSDQLPVLQHALMRTWEYWLSHHTPGAPLDFEDYEKIGGLDKAISEHAGEALKDACSRIGERSEIVLRRLFQRLSDKDHYGRETRRPTAIRELAEVCQAPLSQIYEAVECFRKEGRSFLTPFSGTLEETDEIDITHECLLRKWTEVLQWNREEDESRRVYVRLAARAEEAVAQEQTKASKFPGSRREFADYLQGSLLERSLEWWNARKPNSAWAARYNPNFALTEKFLNESRRNADEQRARLRKRRWLNGLFAILPLAIIITGFGWMSYMRKEKAATARALASNAELAGVRDAPHVSGLLAAGSLDHQPTPQAETALASALNLLPEPLQQLTGRHASTAVFSTDGKWLAVGGRGGIDLYDAATGEKKHTLDHRGQDVTQLVFPGSQYVIAAIGKQVVIWTTDAETEIRALDCPGDIKSLSTSGDGTVIAAVCGEIRLWKAPNVDGRTLSLGKGQDVANIKAVAVSDSGDRIAYLHAGKDSWSIETIEDLTSKEPPHSTLYQGQQGTALPSAQKVMAQANLGIDLPEDLRFDPRDSNVLITAGSSVLSWDAAKHVESKRALAGVSWSGRSGKPISQTNSVPPHSLLFKPSSPAKRLSFSDDKSLLAVTGAGIARLWDTAHGADVARLICEPALSSIAVSVQAHRVAGVAQDGSVHLWRLHGILSPFSNALFRSEGAYLITHQNSLTSSEIISPGAGVVKSFPDWSSDHSYRPLTISKDGAVVAGINYPTFDKLSVSRFDKGSVGKTFWTGSQKDQTIYQTSFTFSPDNRYVAGGVESQSKLWLAIWDSHGAETPLKIPIPAGFFDFSSDSKYIFFAGKDHGLRRFEAATGKELPLSWTGKEKIVQLAASPKGQFVAAIELHNCDDDSGNGAPAQKDRQLSVVRILNYPDGGQHSRWTLPSCIGNLVWSRDERYLLTLSDGKILQLWDVNSAAELTQMVHESEVLDFDLTPDLQITMVDHARFFRLHWKPEDLKADICRRVAGQNLTSDEWEKYAPGQAHEQVCPSELPKLARW